MMSVRRHVVERVRILVRPSIWAWREPTGCLFVTPIFLTQRLSFHNATFYPRSPARKAEYEPNEGFHSLAGLTCEPNPPTDLINALSLPTTKALVWVDNPPITRTGNFLDQPKPIIETSIHVAKRRGSLLPIYIYCCSTVDF
jgi:hypothetical protein